MHSLSFTIAPGTVTGFLGPNGAGKSTTMRMIMGLDRPTPGTVTVNGKPYRQHRSPAFPTEDHTVTKLYDDPAAFSDDLLAGFLDVYADRVVGVPGGVVRATETPPGKVAVVVGGGSGHYPAFCGVVGPGFADGAVVGNIFTSPSTKDAVAVGRAAASDAGLLFSCLLYTSPSPRDRS